MSEIPRHSGALYSPADEYPPPMSPRWAQTSRSRSVSATSTARRSTRSTRRSRLLLKARRIQRWGIRRFNSLSLLQKILLVLLLAVGITLGVLTLVFHEKILHSMLPVKRTLKNWKAGWMLIFLMCFCTAFPPIVGYAFSVTLAGFVYGFPHGWFIIASATILGSTSAFLLCRNFLKSFAKRMVATDKRFAALSLTLKHDGVKLLCMIRLCPLPYSISNGAMSTFPTVTPGAFMLATACATPKLLIQVWIGDRLSILAEAEDQKMDPKVKILNWASIIFGIVLGVGTGWIIYRRTITRAKQLEEMERAQMTANGAEFTDDSGSEADLEAHRAAGLVAGLIDGEELGPAGLFTDDYEDDEDAEEVEFDDERDRVRLEERETSVQSPVVEGRKSNDSGGLL